jgi:hypothetical protein
MNETLEAGRELDVLVAEKIFLWEWWRSSSTGRRCLFAPGAIPRCSGEWFLERADGSEALVGDWDCWSGPHYSTAIGAAWEVVKHLIERGYSFDMGTREDFTLMMWEVTLQPPDFKSMEDWTGAVGETAPLAICRAALLAVSATQGTT